MWSRCLRLILLTITQSRHHQQQPHLLQQLKIIPKFEGGLHQEQIFTPSAIISDGPLKLTCVVEDNPAVMQPQSPTPARLSFPHLQTGVLPKILSPFTKAGRLTQCQRQTSSANSRNATSLDVLSLDPDRTSAMKQQQLQAAHLEKQLLTSPALLAKTLIDTGDLQTPLDHFLQVHECYRCAALVLLYRNFFQLLRTRFPNSSTSEVPQFISAAYLQTLPGGPPQDRDDRAWVLSLAITILDILRTLPTSSGARFLQPMLLVIADSGFRPGNLTFMISRLRELDTLLCNAYSNPSRSFCPRFK